MESLAKTRILGLDTGTNSLGWAVVDRLPDNSYELVDKGVNIFQEGVNIEKGTIEKSRAAERTSHRSLRKIYWRRKVRKIRVLAVLSEAGLCPELSSEQLHRWRVQGEYPVSNEAFMRWQKTDELSGTNPYFARVKSVEQELNMNEQVNRYLVGRALYHIAQRRGFLSNRKEQADANKSGAVSEGIKELTQKIEDAGCTYLCQYFYRLYLNGERIRSCYTDRKEHYIKEFDAICTKQHFDDELVQKLRKAIFDQRPLKSQRRGVAKCPFEPTKRCAPISHPLFEEFRMWQFIRNIKIQTATDTDMRVLTDDEVAKILPLWGRKSKNNFNFDDIAKTLAGKGKYCYYKSGENKPYLFNYHMDSNVAGSPVSARLREIFGEDILRNREQIDIIWHALDNFDDDLKLREWGIRHYQLSEEQADKLAGIRLQQGFASLSLKAMENIVPLMRDYRLPYTEATLIAKLKDLIKDYDFANEIHESLIDDITEYLSNPTDKNGKPIYSRQERKDMLWTKWRERYRLQAKDLERLYHPSMIETYRKVENKKNGAYQLESPRISALKNPMAMRSMFRMKAVVNQLLREGTIDENTVVHIEFARELNDANHRSALRKYQRDLAKEREEAIEQIKPYVENPTDNDILKYLLWKDQDGECIYTKKKISIAALFNGTDFDVEHTIPRSMGGDTTRENLTICDSKYNREVKKTNLPSTLADFELIQANIAKWKEKYEALDKKIRKSNTSGASSKEAKDSIISNRHYLELQRDFWKAKYTSFVIDEKDVTGFTRRQGTDISVINRYGRLFLLSLFKRVDVVKGSMTAAFRKQWGLQNVYEKKSRDNHVHHCIDAITIACMGKAEYDFLAAYYREDEQNQYHSSGHIFPKPWKSFTEDVRNIENELLVAHYTSNPMGKQTRKRLRNTKGKVIAGRFAQGDTARGALHMETNYGAIKLDGETKYVLRVPIDSKDLKVDCIVDPVVREKVAEAIRQYGSIAKALEAGGIWMNKEKGVKINKVRVIQPRVQNPMEIRNHRDVSKHEYKRKFYVKNDTNYMVAIYENETTQKRTYKVVNNLDAAMKMNRKEALFPESSGVGYQLKMRLKIGDLVLLYENTPDEIYHANQAELVRRLYKVVGMGISGAYIQIKLRHHQEARPSGDLKQINGLFVQGEPFDGIRMLTHSQIRALVEGEDFNLTETGKIVFNHA